MYDIHIYICLTRSQWRHQGVACKACERQWINCKHRAECRGKNSPKSNLYINTIRNGYWGHSWEISISELVASTKLSAKVEILKGQFTTYSLYSCFLRNYDRRVSCVYEKEWNSQELAHCIYTIQNGYRAHFWEILTVELVASVEQGAEFKNLK